MELWEPTGSWPLECRVGVRISHAPSCVCESLPPRVENFLSVTLPCSDVFGHEALRRLPGIPETARWFVQCEPCARRSRFLFPASLLIAGISFQQPSLQWYLLFFVLMGWLRGGFLTLPWLPPGCRQGVPWLPHGYASFTTHCVAGILKIIYSLILCPGPVDAARHSTPRPQGRKRRPQNQRRAPLRNALRSSYVLALWPSDHEGAAH